MGPLDLNKTQNILFYKRNRLIISCLSIVHLLFILLRFFERNNLKCLFTKMYNHRCLDIMYLRTSLKDYSDIS
jgi:hypothetical protein